MAATYTLGVEMVLCGSGLAPRPDFKAVRLGPAVRLEKADRTTLIQQLCHRADPKRVGVSSWFLTLN
jgi:hypothetical protein